MPENTHILYHKPFRDLWIGHTISQFGDALFYVTNAFIINKLTGSAAMVGLNGALETAPFLFLSPYAGALADRLDRRKILITTDLICFAILMLLALTPLVFNQIPAWLILACGLLTGSTRVFFHPARNAAVPNVAGDGRVAEANAFNASTVNLAYMGGLALSASLLGILYRLPLHQFYASITGFNALTCLASAYYVRRIPPQVPKREEVEEHDVKRDLREGVKYIRGRHDLIAMLTATLVVNLTIAPFFPVYVRANELWFGNKPSMLTWFECSFFVGMVVGSAALSRWPFRKLGWGIAIGYVGVALTVVAMAVLRTPPLWVLCNFAAGVALPYAWIPTDTYLQVSVPDGMRGRVQSARSMVNMGAQPIGLSLGGLFIDRFGLVACFAGMGIGSAVAGLVGVLDPVLRKTDVKEIDEGVPPE